MQDKVEMSSVEFDAIKGIAAGLFFMALTGLVTGLFPNPFYVRMIPVTVLDYFFLFTTSLLAAIYFGKKQCTFTEDRLAGLGGLTGFLAFSCPVCNIVLVTFFSSSVIMSYLDPLRPFFGVTSTLLLALFVYRGFS